MMRRFEEKELGTMRVCIRSGVVVDCLRWSFQSAPDFGGAEERFPRRWCLTTIETWFSTLTWKRCEKQKDIVCSDRSHPYVCPHPARIEFAWLVVFELNCGGTCWFSYSSNSLKSVRVEGLKNELDPTHPESSNYSSRVLPSFVCNIYLLLQDSLFTD